MDINNHKTFHPCVKHIVPQQTGRLTKTTPLTSANMSGFSAIYGVYTVVRGRYCVTLPIPAPDPALASQTFIVTGANTGLGYEACLHLARIGVGRLILAVRTVSKGEEAKQKILDAIVVNGWRRDKQITPIEMDVWQLDMDSLPSIKTFAGRCTTELDRIDGVLANAGIMTTKLEFSPDAVSPASGQVDKYERTFQINILGTIYLYLLLLPAMRASASRTGSPCRFSIPNSALHYMAPTAELVAGMKQQSGSGIQTTKKTTETQTPIIDGLNDATKANMAGRYPISKLLVLYAVRELASRSSSGITTKSKQIILNTPNPSGCHSDLTRELADDKATQVFQRYLSRTGEEGARTLVHGLLAGPETVGQYLSDCKIEM